MEADSDFKVLYAAKKDFPFVYQRKKGRQTIVVALNPSPKQVKKVILCDCSTDEPQLLIGKTELVPKGRNRCQITVAAGSFGIVKV